jgi:excisionase family DNA binding protein
MENDFVKISDAAKMIGVTPKTLRVWEKEGKLKSFRTFGKHRRYKISEIKSLIGGQ